MRSKKITFIILLIFINFCSTQGYKRRLGYFSKISNTITMDDNMILEDSLRYTQDCHFGMSYYLDTDFINNNLEKMTNGDNSIIGYHNLKIEFKLYPVIAGIFGGIMGVFCINFSGYAIHNGIDKNQNLDK